MRLPRRRSFRAAGPRRAPRLFGPWLRRCCRREWPYRSRSPRASRSMSTSPSPTARNVSAPFLVDDHLAGHDLRDEPDVLRINTDLALERRQRDHVTSSENTVACGVTISSLSVSAMTCLSTRCDAEAHAGDLLDPALHVEVPLGHASCLPSRISLKPRTVSATAHLPAFAAGEHLRRAERLAEEALDLARAVHRELVVGRQLVHAEDGDDVLQVLEPLQHALHARGRRRSAPRRQSRAPAPARWRPADRRRDRCRARRSIARARSSRRGGRTSSPAPGRSGRRPARTPPGTT